MRLALLAALVVSSTAHADPASIARAIVVDQLGALHAPQAFIATLAPNAVILGNGSFALASSSNAPAVVATMMRPPLTQTFVNSVDAGEADGALWFSANVIFADASGCGGTDARLVELAVVDHDRWSVVAVSFASTSELTAPGDVLDRPHPGPLTSYLGSFTALEDALRDDRSAMVAVGDTAFGLGRGEARHALEPLHADGGTITQAIEVHRPRWGFAFGSLAIPGDRSAQVMLVAIPEGRFWTPVAVGVIAPGSTRLRCAYPPVTSTSLQSKTISP